MSEDSWMLSPLISNLLLLENQLPLLVLDCLFQCLIKENNHEPFIKYNSLSELSFMFIEIYTIGHLELIDGAWRSGIYLIT